MYHLFLLNIHGSAVSISKDVEKRLKFMLNSQDTDVVFDLHVNNSGVPEMFAEFRRHVWELIQEHALKAVDDYRDGRICHMAVAYPANGLRTKLFWSILISGPFIKRILFQFFASKFLPTVIISLIYTIWY